MISIKNNIGRNRLVTATLLGSKVNQKSPYSLEYQSILAYATSNAIDAPADYESAMIDLAIRRINSKEVWSKVLGIYGLGNANKLFSQINLKTPGTYNLSEVGTVVFSNKDGSKASNTSSLYITGINPSNLTIGGISGKISGNASNQSPIGVRNGSTVNSYLLPYAGTTARYCVQSAQFSYVRPIYYKNFAGTNNFTANRESGDVVLYMNGKEVARSASAYLDTIDNDIALLAVNDSTQLFTLTGYFAQYAAVIAPGATPSDVFDLWSACELMRSGIKAVKAPYSLELKEWASTDTPDVYIISGQSNALGTAPFSSAPEGYDAPHINSWYLQYNSLDFDQLQAGNDNAFLGVKTTHGVEIKLSRLIDSNSAKPVYFIKVAIGSTAVNPTPVGNTFHPLATSTLYPELVGLIGDGLAAITQRHGGYNLKGTIWVHGEADSSNETFATNYRTNLNTVINQLKTDLSISDFKFYCAKMNSLSESHNPFYAIVNSHLDDMLTANEIDGVIDAEGCALADGQHYSSAGYDKLATRFYNAINP